MQFLLVELLGLGFLVIPVRKEDSKVVKRHLSEGSGKSCVRLPIHEVANHDQDLNDHHHGENGRGQARLARGTGSSLGGHALGCYGHVPLDLVEPVSDFVQRVLQVVIAADRLNGAGVTLGLLGLVLQDGCTSLVDLRHVRPTVKVEKLSLCWGREEIEKLKGCTNLTSREIPTISRWLASTASTSWRRIVSTGTCWTGTPPPGCGTTTVDRMVKKICRFQN